MSDVLRVEVVPSEEGTISLQVSSAAWRTVEHVRVLLTIGLEGDQRGEHQCSLECFHFLHLAGLIIIIISRIEIS